MLRSDRMTRILKRYIRILTATAALLLLPAGLKAQFYVTGDNPGRLKWNTIDTDNFSIIYPQGSDSLARNMVTSSKNTGFPYPEVPVTSTREGCRS